MIAPLRLFGDDQSIYGMCWQRANGDWALEVYRTKVGRERSRRNLTRLGLTKFLLFEVTAKEIVRRSQLITPQSDELPR